MDETRMMITIQTWTAILFALACYLISPLLSLIVVLWLFWLIQRPAISLSLIGGFSLALPALSYLPLSTDDATRLFAVVASMQTVPLGNLYHWLRLWAQDYLNYPLFTAMMYVTARHFQNDVLPFVVAGVTYAAIMYTVQRFGAVMHLQPTITLLTTIASLLWISFLELVSSMRFTMACSLALLIVVQVYLAPKSRHFWLAQLWLLVPVLIHPGALIIVVPTLLTTFMRPGKVWVKGIWAAVLVALLGYFVIFQAHYSYIAMLVTRFTSYQTGAFSYVTSPQRLLHLAEGLIIMLAGALQLMCLGRRDALTTPAMRTLRTLLLTDLGFIIVSLLVVNIAIRYMTVLPIIGLLGVAGMTADHVRTSQTVKWLNVVLLCGVCGAGLIYNISFLHMTFTTIHWLFPLAGYGPF